MNIDESTLKKIAETTGGKYFRARDTDELEEIYATLRDGDCYMLCSDGLTGHVEDHEIKQEMQGEDAQEIAQRLVDMTLERGATDNVTVVVVRSLSQGQDDVWSGAASEPSEQPVSEVEPPEIDWSIGN